MPTRFTDTITTEEELRGVVGYPLERTANKVIGQIDRHCRAFIARSPFMLISSSDAQGRVDVSPKGDPPGFVHVLDEQTLAIPDRPGNRRADTFSNIVQNPQIGLLFLVPGKRETLRVSGTALLVRDLWLREQMLVHGNLPELALVVSVREVFFHCAKCIIRSGLWNEEEWPELDGLPTLAQISVDHSKLDATVEEIETAIDTAYREQLY